MLFQASAFEKHSFNHQIFYIKRDDLLDKHFSGNKARKFYYFLSHDFPHIQRVISSGSNQSNAMYSLSVLAKHKGWEFIYCCDHLPSFLKNNPIGNYQAALANGMKLIESHERDVEILKWSDAHTLHVKEGGRQKEAEEGIALLAQELCQDVATHGIEDPYLFLPSGTGTTALFLQKHLPFLVYTCPTVGNSDYLKQQWQMIDHGLTSLPIILEGSQKFHYGKLYPELFMLWQELKEKMGVEFDLVYDPVGWHVFLEHHKSLKGTPIYLHQGGLLGNASMLARYARKANML